MISRNASTAADGSAAEPPNNIGPSDEIPPWFIRHLNEGVPLSPEIQAAIEDMVTPLYRQMVLQEKDPLLRATGNAAVVAHAIELLEQPAVLEAAKRASDDPGARDEFLKVLQSHLKLAAQHAKTVQLHLQLRRAKHAAWQVPADQYGIMTRCGHGI